MITRAPKTEQQGFWRAKISNTFVIFFHTHSNGEITSTSRINEQLRIKKKTNEGTRWVRLEFTMEVWHQLKFTKVVHWIDIKRED